MGDLVQTRAEMGVRTPNSAGRIVVTFPQLLDINVGSRAVVHGSLIITTEKRCGLNKYESLGEILLCQGCTYSAIKSKRLVSMQKYAKGPKSSQQYYCGGIPSMTPIARVGYSWGTWEPGSHEILSLKRNIC